MNISKLIIELEKIKKAQGDIEVTTTGCLLDDGFSTAGNNNLPDVFESTVESMTVHRDSSSLGCRVRLDFHC